VETERPGGPFGFKTTTTLLKMTYLVAFIVGATVANSIYFYNRERKDVPFWYPFVTDVVVVTVSGGALGAIAYDVLLDP
jgi:hypothetical protein